jgi:hypothetical protein
VEGIEPSTPPSWVVASFLSAGEEIAMLREIAGTLLLDRFLDQLRD